MKKMMIGVMSLLIGASLFAAGPNFVDKNGDGTCDSYVSRGNKTTYEAGIAGSGQYKTSETEKGKGQGQHKFREEVPGQGKNRKN